MPIVLVDSNLEDLDENGRGYLTSNRVLLVSIPRGPCTLVLVTALPASQSLEFPRIGVMHSPHVTSCQWKTCRIARGGLS